MRLTALLKSRALIFALCLTAWSVPTLAQSQQQPATDPVADAARKAREQKKTEPKPKKVYTDDDFGRVGGAGATQSAGAAQTGSGGAEGNAQAVAKGEKKEGTPAEEQDEEKKWRKRFKGMHDKIAQAEEELNILQRELDRGQVQYYSDPQKALKEQNTRDDVNEKTSKINAKKKEIEQLKQQLSDLEDELRKAGGDPGWAR